MNNQFLMYKNRPLVKNKDTIYYGYVSDGFVVMFQILGYGDPEDNKPSVPNNISLSLLSTNKDFSEIAIKNSTTKNSMYKALELADIWLTQAVENQNKQS